MVSSMHQQVLITLMVSMQMQQMMKKQQITIGDYKVQQASNCHVFIVHIPDSRMVFHSQTNHWLTEEELRAAFDFYKQAAGWETEECSE